MSLHPFPPRGDLPPAVPPKAAISEVNFKQTKPIDQLRQKKSLPTLRKSESEYGLGGRMNKVPFDAPPPSGPLPLPPVRTQPSPTAGGTSPTGEPAGRISPVMAQTFAQSASRLASAKQKAKDVWMGRRRGGSTAGLEHMKLPTQIQYVDSPTLPDASPPKHMKQASMGGWRPNFFRETVDTDNAPRYKGPSSAPAATQMPSTPWPTAETLNPTLPKDTPSKAIAVLQTPPVFLERHNNTRRSPELKPSEPPARTGQSPSKLVSESPPPALSPERKPAERKPVPTLERKPSLLEKERTRANTDAGNENVSPPTNMLIDSPPEKKPVRRKRKKSNVHISSGHQRQRSTAVAVAPTSLLQNELASLQRRALRQTEKFTILSLNDVEVLSQELLQLESRCDYLRQTRSSLRQGRRALHTRMINYLRTARPGMFSQENLLKQEEALADLDNAIEEWETKLEKAEKRRADIKQKLLEHVAAALRVVKTLPPTDKDSLLDTPPATPDGSNNQGQMKQRREPESITVYALLSDVKQENANQPIICT